MSEQKRKPCKLVWFKFYPTDFFPVMRMTNEEAGIIFKNLLENLAANEAPKNTPEERMIEEAKAYSETRRQAVMHRWQSNKPIPLPKNKAEVIAFAEDNGLDVDAALKWAGINLKERKGNDKNGEPIHNWKKACAGYCESLKNKN